MTVSPHFVSRLLETSSAGYGAAAAHCLLRDHPEVAERFGQSAFASWKDHLSQRVKELASALLVGDDNLFVNEVRWVRTSLRSREVPKSDLLAGLRTLRQVLAEELPIDGRDLALSYLDAAVEEINETDWEQGAGSEIAESEPPLSPGAQDYLEAALSGNRSAAAEIALEAVAGGRSLMEVHEEVLAPAQREAGRLWHCAELTVAQEHALTAITKSTIAQLVEKVDRKPPNGHSALVAVVPGNAHSVGSLSFAQLLEVDGWRAVSLGCELPASEVIHALEDFKPDLLALSVALTLQMRATLELIGRVRSVRPQIKILLGGRAFTLCPSLGEKLGADATATSFRDALPLAAKLVGQPS